MNKQGPYTGLTVKELIRDADEARKSGKFKWLQEYCPTCHAITFVPEPEGYMYCHSCGRKRSQYAKTNHIVDADKMVGSPSDPVEVECKHCGYPISQRNPSGYCDHLYYPKNCTTCMVRIAHEESPAVSPSRQGRESTEHMGDIAWCECECHTKGTPQPKCDKCYSSEYEESWARELEEILDSGASRNQLGSFLHSMIKTLLENEYVSKEKIKRVLLESTYIKMYARKKILKSLGIEP